MLIIPVLAPLMTQLLGASQGLLPLVVLRRGLAGYLSTRMTGALTSRVSALSLATGSTLVFYPELTDTRDGLSASSAIYYVISRRSLQSSGVIVGGDDSVS